MPLMRHLRVCCIAANYSITIRCTMSPPGDISIEFRFICDELGLRSLPVWPLPAHHRASATSDCVRSFSNSPSPTHSRVTPRRSIALGQFNEEPMERHNPTLAFTRVHVLDLCPKKALCFRSMFPSSTSTFFMQLGYFTKFHPSCFASRFASILFQISKALTGTDKKDLIRKLPKFIYDEEKASE
ncbi:hypothetical protein GW17_00035727, partial [Ensete ventricosum]